jgi:hypothetical protein
VRRLDIIKQVMAFDAVKVVQLKVCVALAELVTKETACNRAVISLLERLYPLDFGLVSSAQALRRGVRQNKHLQFPLAFG